MLWYKDDEIEIDFNIIPCTTMLFPLPSMSKQEKKEITDKPFLNKKPLFVTILDKRKTEQIEYSFWIDKGFRFNGADIPRIFWRLIGSMTEPEFQIPALIHDYSCSNKDCLKNDRLLSSKVFRGLLLASGVSKFKADVMTFCVDGYQHFCHW